MFHLEHTVFETKIGQGFALLLQRADDGSFRCAIGRLASEHEGAYGVSEAEGTDMADVIGRAVRAAIPELRRADNIAIENALNDLLGEGEE